MDPHVVFDCQEIVPNRFTLTMAAAARARALNRGAQARRDLPHASVSDLSLHEIADGAFTQDELAPFLPGLQQQHFFPLLIQQQPSFAATARQALPPHPSPLRRRRFIDDATNR